MVMITKYDLENCFLCEVFVLSAMPTFEINRNLGNFKYLVYLQFS